MTPSTLSFPRDFTIKLCVLAATAALAACSSSSTSSPSSPGDTGATDVGAGTPKPAVAFFRGTLARGADASKEFSDPFFDGVKADATAAGDDGHDALLGAAHLGTTVDQFVGLDTWSTDANMDAVYANPQVVSFGSSFYAAPPEFATFYVTDFHQWGTTDSGDASTPHYFVFVRGRFGAAPAAIQSIHDAFASSTQEKAEAAGEVAHIVYSGRHDPQDALVVDVWTSDAGIEAYYGGADVKNAIASLFDATGPNFGVYRSTDWVTW